MARARRVVRGSRTVRETLWLGIAPTNTNLAASAAALVSSLNAAALALRPFTIVRTHLSWNVRTDQEAASEFYAAAVGIAVVSDQASTVGVTAVPTPVTDIDSDMFFLWDAMFGRFVISQGTDGIFARVDSKAMRKVNGDQDIVFVIEDEAVIGTDGVNVTMMGRMLVKLH